MLDDVEPPVEGLLDCGRYRTRRTAGHIDHGGGCWQSRKPADDFEIQGSFGTEMVVQIRPCRSGGGGKLRGGYLFVSALGKQTLGYLEDLLAAIARVQTSSPRGLRLCHVMTVTRSFRSDQTVGSVVATCYINGPSSPPTVFAHPCVTRLRRANT